jgi:hypothetical protein
MKSVGNRHGKCCQRCEDGWNRALLTGLKGWSHEIGKAFRWFHWIDLKFKGCRFMFILIKNVFFTPNFLKMAPIRVRFSPGFPPGAGFPGEEFAPACF